MFLGGWTLGKLAYFTTCQEGKYLGNINNRGSIRRLDHLKKMWMSELLLHTTLMLLLYYNILWVHTLYNTTIDDIIPVCFSIIIITDAKRFWHANTAVHLISLIASFLYQSVRQTRNYSLGVFISHYPPPSPSHKS